MIKKEHVISLDIILTILCIKTPNNVYSYGVSKYNETSK